MKPNFLIILVIIGLITNSMAIAGGQEGNGGHGVHIQGNIYSFDLYESGIHKNPFFNQKIETDPAFLKRVNAILPSELPAKLVAQKLSEVKAMTKINGLLLLKILESLKWRIIDSSLLDTGDGNKTPIDKSELKILQAAVRLGNVVRLDRDALSIMDPANRAALVLHEIIYTWFASMPIDNPTKSAHTRNVVAYLFSRDIEKLNINDWKNSFPHYNRPHGFIGWDDRDVLFWERDSETILMTPSYSFDSMTIRDGGGIDRRSLGFISPYHELSEDDIRLVCNGHKGNVYQFRTVYKIIISKDFIFTNDGKEEREYDFTPESPAQCQKWILKRAQEIFYYFGHFHK